MNIQFRIYDEFNFNKFSLSFFFLVFLHLSYVYQSKKPHTSISHCHANDLSDQPYDILSDPYAPFPTNILHENKVRKPQLQKLVCVHPNLCNLYAMRSLLERRIAWSIKNLLRHTFWTLLFEDYYYFIVKEAFY